MKIAIITDSNSGITQEEAKNLGIFLLPMPFLIDGEEYFEDVNLTQQQFYEKLMQDASVSTSQPSIFAVTEMWQECLKNYDQIIHIPMSSALSSGCETAITLSKDFDNKVFVVNNRRISISLKQAIYDAISLVKQGYNAEEVKKYLENTSLDASIYIMVSTLKYLKKGGRITPAVAAIGSLLNIKPVLSIQGGKLDKFCNVMAVNLGKKKMISAIINDIETRFSEALKKGKLKIGMAYSNCKDKCLEFKKEADLALKPYNLEVEFVDPLSLSVACHIGDGALAIGCYISA